MDIPSLFMIPSAVSSGKVHSVFPNSTDADFDFARSSTASRVNSDGLIETVASGQARLNYEIEGGLVNTKPSLLLEPQSTNLVTYSEDFSNSYWTKTGATVQSGFVSPDGTANAYKLVEDTANSVHRIFATSTVSTSPNASISVFVKYNGRRYVLIRFADQSVGRWYDLINGTLGDAYLGSPNNSTIDKMTNDWYRITLSHTSNAQARCEFWVSDTQSISSYTGDGISGVFIYGAQLEALSYPTSYIPTNGSTQTRAAETCNGAGTSSIFESSEGILYAEIAALENPTTSALDISISNGATTNYVRLEYYTDGKIYGTIYDGSFAASSTTVTQTNFNKIAVFWRTSGSKFALNGAITNFTGKIFSANTFNTLQFAAGNGTSAPFYGKIRDIRVYNTKEMTDSEVDILLTKITS